MAGIFSLNTGVREVWFLLAGLVGAVLFFTLYPSQHPASSVAISTDKKNVELRAVEHLSRLGYSLDDYQTEVQIKTSSALLDSLQQEFGRPGAIEKLKAGDVGVLKPFYWKVSFNNPFESDGSGSVPGGRDGGAEDSIVVQFDMEGRFIELHNSTGRLPESRIRRTVLNSVFAAGPDSAGVVSFQAVPDSLLPRYLYFDLEQPEQMTPEERTKQLVSNLSSGRPFRLNRSEAESIARYFIGRSGWADGEFVRDTLFIERVENFNTAHVIFSSAEPVFGQQVTLDVQVSAVGSLLGMQASYNGSENGSATWSEIISILRTLLILIFIFTCAIIFFYRIRARAIDARSALVVSILTGLGVSVLIMLNLADQLNFFSEPNDWYSSIGVLITAGMGGASSAIIFFVLFATGDSITRQYRQTKLTTYDYIRQGMLFNKPVGTILLRAISLSLVLAGGWTLLITALPGLWLHLSPDELFIHGTTAWPPVSLLLGNLLLSLVYVLGVFLVIGSQVYSRTRSRWWVIFAVMVLSAFLFPFGMEVGPRWMELIAGAVIGLGCYFIFDRWDFSTLLLVHFFFLGWLGTASGWITQGSPDLYIFICFLIFLLALGCGGMLAIWMGKEEKVLPRYVPEYVEELAQEERIKQELQIARQVQQSFLPTRIPDIGRLDMAAFCKPAYETGGDYYDFVRLDDHRLGVAIGDVSGKGIQAAFYMTFIKGILHSLCHETDSPSELLKKMNRLFFDNAQKGTFISLVYGIIDTRNSTFTFSRAGHNPILHLARNDDTVRELQPGGLGIGLTREASFDDNIREIQLDLTEGDLLMLYTDGIVEALNEKHRFYGTDRLHNLLMSLREKSSGEIVENLFKNVNTFIGNASQHDDMTLMIIRFGKDPV